MRATKLSVSVVLAITLAVTAWAVMHRSTFLEAAKTPAEAKAAVDPKAAEPAGAEPNAAADPLVDIGPFVAGSDRALQKSGFTGCPLVNVMITPEDQDYAQVAAILQDAEVGEALRPFTGCLLDRRVLSEYAREEKFEVQGVQIIVRSMSGGYLGGLRYGFNKAELVGLLQRVIANHPRAIHRSPLFSRLVNKPDTILVVEQLDGVERATALVDLIEEQLGSADDRVAQLRSLLGQ